MTRRALITGLDGQDGSILAQRLLHKGYDVFGTVRPGSRRNPDREQVAVIEADLRSSSVCHDLVQNSRPDVVFHFAGISSVGYSWQHPVETAQVNGNSAISLLNSLMDLQHSSATELTFVNASSGEIFAGTADVPQNEGTALAPLSPYGASKAFSHNMVQVYRSRGLKASNAIFYNHESTLRPVRFVTRKITAAAAAISRGKQDLLELGNLDARRDWGWAPDYVDAAIRMAEHNKGDDYVVATGEAHSIRDFVEAAFRAVGIADWDSLVVSSNEFVRPAESAEMVGDATKAKEVLSWEPTTRFHDIVRIMVEHDLSLL